MSEYSKLPDTAWHIGYVKKKDSRRHRARCLYYEESKCRIAGDYCSGSSHCQNYSDTIEDYVRREKLYVDKCLNPAKKGAGVIPYRRKNNQQQKTRTVNYGLYIRMCPFCKKDIHLDKMVNHVKTDCLMFEWERNAEIKTVKVIKHPEKKNKNKKSSVKSKLKNICPACLNCKENICLITKRKMNMTRCNQFKQKVNSV